MKALEKSKIGSMELKNRIFYAPMGYGLDRYGPHARAYFEARCKGGAAMIFTPYVIPTQVDIMTATPLSCREDMKKMAEMAHSYGAKACMQVVPGLGRVKRYLVHVLENSPEPVYSASAVPEFYYDERTTVELSKELIQEQLERFRDAVRFIVNESGYDCIELHSYGGYLADCFLTERWNKRTDEYGGKDIRSRAKYVLDILHVIKEEAGPDFPVFVKFTPCHFIDEPGYRTIEEGLELAKIFEEAGADMLHVDAGCYDNWELCMPPSYQQEQTYAVTAAERVKEVVSIPVCAAGKLGYPERGEETLKRGKLDYIVVGRGMLADPEYVNKLKCGCIDDIRPCIGCDEGCIRRVSLGNDSISCAVNPSTGFEIFRALPKSETPKKILVVGAGPGGVTAAMDARLAGHDVEVWEKRSRIGGLLTAAGRPSFKKEIADLLSYYRLQLCKLGVPVRYNMEADAESILAYGADEVILATGSVPIVPGSIPGIHSKNVVTAVDALNDVATVGKRIVMVGSGLVGCEAALHLQTFGKEIDIIEMMPEIMPVDVFIQSRNMVMKMIERNEHIHVHTSTKLLRVEPGCAVVEQDGKEVRMPCDTVMLALGLTAADNLYDQLKDRISVHNLGRNNLVLHATSAAREAVLDIQGVDKEVYTRQFRKWN